MLLLTWRLTILLPQKKRDSEDEDEELNTLSAVNQGVSSRQIEEQQRQMVQEMAPFNENVVMQTPAAKLPASPSVQSTMEEHDTLF